MVQNILLILIWIAICLLGGWAGDHFCSLGFWPGVAVTAVSLFVNGWLAEWEDRQQDRDE